MIPTTSKWVDLSLLHPRFATRLELFFGDGRIANKVAVVSGCRSYAEQKRLYDKYRAGKGNLAANPDWKRPGGFFHGSFHQEQRDGYAYAVDLRIIGDVSQTEVTAVARKYGFRPTVPGEWWHFQPRNEEEWFPSTSFPDEDKPILPMDWAGVLEFIAGVGLNALGFWCGKADGIFGRKTKEAVKGLQRTLLLSVNGVVDGNVWNGLWNPEVPHGL